MTKRYKINSEYKLTVFRKESSGEVYEDFPSDTPGLCYCYHHLFGHIWLVFITN
ncbi:hypothetical protein ES703_57390 [subsurface metagenome]